MYPAQFPKQGYLLKNTSYLSTSHSSIPEIFSGHLLGHSAPLPQSSPASWVQSPFYNEDPEAQRWSNGHRLHCGRGSSGGFKPRLLYPILCTLVPSIPPIEPDTKSKIASFKNKKKRWLILDQQTYFSTELPYDPTIPLLGTDLQKTIRERIHTLQCSWLHHLW